MQTAVVEICIDSVASAEHARQGGAQRVELCANLHEGGVTPSAGMIKMVRQAFPPPGQLMVLIRCRGGDFLYSPEELLVMQEDIEVCSQLGADGVVLGCLTATGEVDSDATATLMRTALIKGLQVTFHRAFDLCRDMSAALQQLVRLGVQRVLTSGGKPSALAGAGMIAQLVGEAGHDIIVVAGGGLTEENVEEVVRRSGVLEVHSTAKRAVFSKMAYKRVGMSLCSGQLPSDYAWGEAEGGRVAALLDATQKAVAALPGHA
ncbi:copper homeostasis protein cutC [Haematococcus lacustris]